MRFIPVIATLATVLAACTPTQTAQVTMNSIAPVSTGASLPPMQSFAAVRGTPPARGNADIARDILDLAFRMESGRPLPVFTRFEGPITVALAGEVPPTAHSDLARVMGRLRAEAGIDIRSARTGENAAVTIDFQPKAAMRRVVPQAACFVVPRVSSFAEYRARRGSEVTDWASVTRRERAAIIVPSDTAPQEVRDCLHEELAQSIGPLNDLYRLPDSVFNDDNFHTVLTGFDMLVLRVHYDPALRSGMTEAEVAARLPAILARLNPAGEGRGTGMDRMAPRPWIDAVGVALGGQGGESRRRDAAERMLSIARAQGWQDNRLAFSWFALGRANVGRDTIRATQAFEQAQRIWNGLPGGEVRAAHVDMQLAAFALADGRFAEALARTDRAIPVVRRAENAALLSTLLMIRAEANAALGRSDEAREARLDSLGWARYGFGTDAQVRARMSEITGLAAMGRRS
ncbi:DUF2927 domain-containing protein [Rhodobacteraceae bacterium HSP-20]|uniref:DUF2927 domain-containing protein n=1 Tax=Paragemmobacter amnigenus TaxID=2852097 RepID=A0ABS6J475_9RHOB|nr:DUF2927 domain-containing protein [Rhodobacter amnigenus]MBU9698558.1 DUF2927 domain-containing protein [Rhodobacter amnigenus]MBV4389785.1 DUF2927 domain-containing protein [Rhodobacter amnigenus]